MAANNRIFYACQAVAIANYCTETGNYSTGNIVHGLQSVGITTNFNLEQAFELGQIQIYENIEGLPDVEVTLEKVLDGYPLIYHLATTGAGAANIGLVARSKQRCDVRLGIYSDELNAVGDDPNSAPVEVYCSGMYVSSVSYTIPVDGNATESVTLVGNNKSWIAGAAMNTTVVNNLSGSDAPKALSGSGGIQRREDVILASSILPKSVFAQDAANITATTGNALLGGVPRVHIQNVTISTDFAREDILELGRKAPYYRAPGFPIEVTCEIEAISVSGDWVTAIEEGNPNYNGTNAQGNNTEEERIKFYLRGGYSFDLGSKNRLSSVSYGGGDAGGGNVSCTYSYSTFNDLTVSGVYLV